MKLFLTKLSQPFLKCHVVLSLIHLWHHFKVPTKADEAISTKLEQKLVLILNINFNELIHNYIKTVTLKSSFLPILAY